MLRCRLPGGIITPTQWLDIDIVLLVHAVETDQQEVVAGKTAGQTLFQIFFNGAAQIVALLLQTLSVC